MSSKDEGKIGETPQERALADVATQRVNDYRQRWLPVQQNLIAATEKMGQPGSVERQQATGGAAAETRERFGAAKEKAAEQEMGQGAGIGSSKFALTQTNLGSDEARSTGIGVSTADQNVDNAYIQGLQNLMQIGRGQAATATGGLEKSAGISAETAANDADIAMKNRAANAKMIGSAVGTGIGYYGGGGASPGGIQSSLY